VHKASDGSKQQNGLVSLQAHFSWCFAIFKPKNLPEQLLKK
jgi:hypothetical protein